MILGITITCLSLIQAQVGAAISESPDLGRSRNALRWIPGHPVSESRPDYSSEGLGFDVRFSDGSQKRWSIRLGAFGPSESPVVVQDAPPCRDRNQICYEYGDVSEWFIEQSGLIEHGFTINSGDTTESNDEYVLDLTVPDDFEILIDGEGVFFLDDDGYEVVKYSELHVFDARGNRLPAEFCRTGRHVRISIRVSDAEFPVVVDPLITTPLWTDFGGQADSWFGVAVSTAGDIDGDGYADVLVGASQYDVSGIDEGCVFVYYGTATGPALSPGTTLCGDQDGAQFGNSVDAAGDVNGDGYGDIIVGSWLYDGAFSDGGRVDVFLGGPTGLNETPAWTVMGGQVNAWLGRSVSSAGDVNHDGYSDVIVGADGYSNGQGQEGYAAAYLGSSAGLSLSPAWTAEGNQAGAFLGYSVGTAGDVNADGFSDVIVGAYSFDDVHIDQGRAWVYAGGISGLSAVPLNTIQVDQAGGLFGFSVATAGDTNGDGYSDVIVGAHLYDNAEINEGGAFLFLGSPAGVSASPDWIGESNDEGAFWGYDVRSAGDVNGDGFGDFVVGAPTYDEGAGAAGASFLFLGGALISTELTSISGGQPDGTGISNGTAGDTDGDGHSDVIVGSYLHTDAIAIEGMARVFSGAADLPSSEPDWTIEGATTSGNLGTVAPAGDVNGDGFADVLVASPNYLNRGKVDVFLGSDTGLALQPAVTIEGESGIRLGKACSSAGDVNGDGFSDIVIGTPVFDLPGGRDEGLVRLFLGSQAGVSSVAAWEVRGFLENANLGSSIACAGDVNGDGFSDVIIGLPGSSNVFLDPPVGRAYVYHGNPAGLAATPHWTAASDACCTLFGGAVASAGDLNGDGYSDVVVGESEVNGLRGRAYVYHGSAVGLEAVPAQTLDGLVDGGRFGRAVSQAGDINGDGFGDLLIAAPEEGLGSVYVYLGSAVGISPVADAELEGQLFDRYFGESITSVGDVNGDGYSDVLIGSPLGSVVLANSGLAHLYLGGPGGLPSLPSWTVGGNWIGSNLGRSVAGSGDVNGDGFSDLLIGEPSLAVAVSNEGAVYSFLGIGGGVTINPRQLRADFSAPVSGGGRTGSADSVSLTILPQNPLGRSDAVVQWQIAPMGTPLDQGVISESVSVSTFNQSPLETISGLSSDVLYRWRARFRYDVASSPYHQFSRWYGSSDPAQTRMTFRTSSAIDVAPVIVTQPSDIDGCFGAFSSLSVVATGSPPPDYQWYKDAVLLADETGPTLLLNGLNPDDAGVYHVQVPNSAGSITSNTAIVSVERLRVCSVLGPQRIVSGETLVLSADVLNPTGLSLQWLRDGVELSNDSRISGAQSTQLTIAEVSQSDAGRYLLRVASAQCSIESSEIDLEVLLAEQQNWDTRFVSPGADSAIDAMLAWDDGTGEAVYLGGKFGRIGGVFSPLVARWNGEHFSPVGKGLGNGMQTTGGALTLTTFDDGCGEALVAAGSFSGFGQSGEISNIAKWDGADWVPLGAGVTFASASGFPLPGQQRVFAIESYDPGGGQELYVGGTFPYSGRMYTPWISKWNGFEWSTVGGPEDALDGGVLAMQVFDDGGGPLLYVGGGFTNAGASIANGLAAWDGNSWVPIGAGLSSSVFGTSAVSDLIVYDDGGGSDLYLAGSFDTFNGQPLNSVARWTGSGFESVGSLEGLFIQVERLGTHDFGQGPVLFASGFFFANDGTSYSLARWNGTDWVYPSGQPPGGIITGFASLDNQGQPEFLVGGSFTGTESKFIPNVAKYLANDELEALAGDGVSGEVRSLLRADGMFTGNLFAAGRFVSAGSRNASNIASWDGAEWTTLGSGLASTGSSAIPGQALAIFDDGSGQALYIGGDFHTAGGIPCQNIAKWDGNAWASVGGGFNGDVKALAVHDDGAGDKLYAAGEFTLAGGQPASYIAGWNGVSWSPVGAGMNAPVDSLVSHDDGAGPQLFAGGSFTQAGADPANHIAAWDGTNWQEVGGGFGGFLPSLIRVNSLVEFDAGSGKELYAGGRFLSANGLQTRYIARWDGAIWSDVGGGMLQSLSTSLETQVTSMTVADDGGGVALFVGGTFIESGGVETRGLAKWNGVEWRGLGTGFLGTTQIVYSMAGFDSGTGPGVFVGGSFESIGTTSSKGIGRWSVGPGQTTLGDMNCDGIVNMADVPLFATALSDPGGYTQAAPDCQITNADFNQDQLVDGRDISGLLDLLVSP